MNAIAPSSHSPYPLMQLNRQKPSRRPFYSLQERTRGTRAPAGWPLYTNRFEEFRTAPARATPVTAVPRLLRGRHDGIDRRGTGRPRRGRRGRPADEVRRHGEVDDAREAAHAPRLREPLRVRYDRAESPTILDAGAGARRRVLEGAAASPRRPPLRPLVRAPSSTDPEDQPQFFHTRRAAAEQRWERDDRNNFNQTRCRSRV